ncbi:ribonuclease H1-like isoform X2 [Physella acuta]|uniref:ribonuclease H1-like isoform X2 n=1 Tax=Physella acuta TaxID=109671 RepID=UPI0027DBB552|nr:ribonuclease H1-like isoform X2 [Physella acuta]
MIRLFSKLTLQAGPKSSHVMSGKYFYAVKRGRVPGVYATWSECEKQIKGFPNPAFKKFSTEADCHSFICDNASSSPSFAVSSNDASATPAEMSGASISSLMSHIYSLKADMKTTKEMVLTLQSGLAEVRTTLKTLEEAVFTAPGSKRHYSTSSGGASSSLDANQTKRPKFDLKAEQFTGSRFSEAEGINVYTDGGCFDNGRCGARAGIGVFWAPDDPDNVSERLPGRPTNNRAEIHAAVRAVQLAKKKGIKNLILHTDSQFLINGITKWIKGWKRNQWTKTTGSPVVNKEDFEELDKQLKNINVKWVYVRGHCGNQANESADRLAKEGAEKSL